MKRLFLKEDYKPLMTVKETEKAIKFVRDSCEKNLCKKLNLTRVSAPLFVFPSTGLNDNLNGYERRVSFDVKNKFVCICFIVYAPGISVFLNSHLFCSVVEK